jgi:hypothetical protein
LALVRRSCDTLPPVVGYGGHRRVARTSVAGVIALALALMAGGRLLTLPDPAAGLRPALPAGPVRLAAVWPKAKVASQPDALPDGTQFAPDLYIDSGTVIGAALTPDKRYTRMLVRAGDRVSELRRVPNSSYPQWSGLMVDGDTLYWAEKTSSDTTAERTRIWRINWRTGADLKMLTADTGDAIFFQSQYDLVLAEGRVYWVAVAFFKVAITQIRSVPADGGTVTVKQIVGPYGFVQWPWLSTASSGQSVPVELYNLKTGKRIKVASGPAEVPKCNALWCRVMIVGSSGLARMDLVHPDGSGRRRIAGAGSAPVVNDVALLDRFDPLALYPTTDPTEASPDEFPTRQLAVYDITTGRTVIVDDDVTTVGGHDGMLWWSRGHEGAYTWYALDLRTLT